MSSSPAVTSGDVTRWQGRVAIVTGASAGIGAAICRSLVRLGMAVVGVARSYQRIQAWRCLPPTETGVARSHQRIQVGKIAVVGVACSHQQMMAYSLKNYWALAQELKGEAGSLTAIQCDISKDEQVQSMFKQVMDKFGAVHLCVNNAGFSTNHSLIDGTPDEWRAMLDVNVVGLCLLTKLAVQSMRERDIDDGHIIHISSIVGNLILPIPHIHFYTSTKHAVRALTEGLRQELREAKSHIRVSSISPGRCKTEFALNTLKDPEAAAKAYAGYEYLTADDVAASVVHVLTAPARVEINDLLMRSTEQVL